MSLDPRLESESTYILDLELCQVRLSHNGEFPWILLIPNEKDIFEIIDLTPDKQQLLIKEIALASQVMKTLFQPTKLNVAALGNVVSQLHIHVVARYNHDKAWPQPIWNSGFYKDYNPEEKGERCRHLKDMFKRILG